jgi:hypothetical protein
MSLADVESALVNAAAAALYQFGTAAPSAACAPVRCYRGWLVGDALGRSIAAGSVDWSVFSRPGMSTNITSYSMA